MVPTRFLFRSRWAALLWAAGICFSAARFAREDAPRLSGSRLSEHGQVAGTEELDANADEANDSNDTGLAALLGQ